MKKVYLIAFTLATLLSSASYAQTQDAYIKLALPTGYNTLFAASGECLMCHNSIFDSNGNPLGIIDDWRSSMMANSSKDPLWKAKVSHEVEVNPALQDIIEDKCTSCHAPAANYDAHYNAQTYYTFSDLENDPIGKDGINCTVCHQITESSFGNNSGHFIINENAEIYGPFVNPTIGPMQNNTGYLATYSTHIRDSRVCGTCHTLITNSVDLSGTPTGNEFVEQSILQEWTNSDYFSNGASCQSCHLPEIADPVIISSMPGWLNTLRTPFGMHYLVGGNVFMQRLFKNFSVELGLTADPVHFDSTMAQTTKMLQEKTLDLSLDIQSRDNDTLWVDLELISKVGHKFPAGFPSRRAFVEFLAITESGDTIFHSGEMDNNFNLIHEDSGYEPHYQMINSEDQVQIYEMVMGDVNLDPTTVLLYADVHLKDNRLVPAGFVSSHYSYDTTKIVGNAFTDSDFNHEDGIEGSGSDKLHFHIPINANEEDIQIVAKVYYQPIHDKWLNEMFSHSTTLIDTFKHFYNSTDKTPVLVAQANLTSSLISIQSIPDQEIMVYPNPAHEYFYIESTSKIIRIEIFDALGRFVKQITPEVDNTRIAVRGNFNSGLHYISIETSEGKHSKKIILR